MMKIDNGLCLETVKRSWSNVLWERSFIHSIRVHFYPWRIIWAADLIRWMIRKWSVKLRPHPWHLSDAAMDLYQRDWLCLSCGVYKEFHHINPSSEPSQKITVCLHSHYRSNMNIVCIIQPNLRIEWVRILFMSSNVHPRASWKYSRGPTVKDLQSVEISAGVNS